MRIIYFALFLLFFQFNSVSAQVLQSYEYQTTHTPATLEVLLTGLIGQVGENFPIPIDSVTAVLNATYEIDVYKVSYTSSHPVIGDIPATGAVAVPRGLPCGPLAVYQHGTVFSRTEVPSHLSIEHFLGSAIAAAGYITLMPDYIGLGDSPGMHPYVHAETEALAGIDLIRATKEMLDEWQANEDSVAMEYSDQLFIFGYSQGGHGAMALFKEIETNYSDEFTVTAAAPMSGPYDMSGTQADVMWDVYATPQYLPYVIASYKSVYPELLEPFDIIYKEEWSALNNFDGDSDAFFAIMDELNIPSTPSDMILDDVLDDYQNDDNHPLKQALRLNDLYDWAPKAPVLMMGCCDDEQVMFPNTPFCYDRFVENGAADPQMIDFCEVFPDVPSFGHGGCIPYCLLWGKQFFDEKVDASCTTVGINELRFESPFQLFPNPTVDVLKISLQAEGQHQNDLTFGIYNLAGRLIEDHIITADGTQEINVSHLSEGLYIVQLRFGPNKAYVSGFVKE